MSLFNVVTDSDETTNQSTESQAQPASWWIDDKTPGVGDRPDWLPEKYKTVKDVAQGYRELEKRLGTAPKEYDWEAGKDWIDVEYEPLREMADYARSKHVPQDVMDKMLSSVGKYLNEFKVDYNEEKAKLGENAKDRLTLINNWAKSNLSEQSYFALTDNLKTADAVLALEELRSKMLNNDTRIPTGNEDISSPEMTLDSIQQELTDNIEKYQKDPQYRKTIQAKINAVADKSSFVDKRY